jgi:hypothetical protein
MDMLLGNSLSFESQQGLAHRPFALLRHRVQARKQAARTSRKAKPYFPGFRDF